jgi:hypothetical protein
MRIQTAFVACSEVEVPKKGMRSGAEPDEMTPLPDWGVICNRQCLPTMAKQPVGREKIHVDQHCRCVVLVFWT